MARNKRAAMEMSVGTLVTIVLLMVVLVMGIILIRNIFGGSTDAVEAINSEVIDEINKAFSDDTRILSIAPGDRTITLDRDKEPAGFAFSIRNRETNPIEISYKVEAVDISKCGDGFSIPEANEYLLGGGGTFSLDTGTTLSLPILVKYVIPRNAPPCTMIYKLTILKRGSAVDYDSSQIIVTID
ncbi:hypothetical protein HYT23_06795 [Candidatus Pacearchaeota archaeon]|nr:hypothetical protein [Candidatus Pacearchaeota archaeon]